MKHLSQIIRGYIEVEKVMSNSAFDKLITLCYTYMPSTKNKCFERIRKSFLLGSSAWIDAKSFYFILIRFVSIFACFCSNIYQRKFAKKRQLIIFCTNQKSVIILRTLTFDSCVWCLRWDKRWKLHSSGKRPWVTFRLKNNAFPVDRWSKRIN